jgi:hypothetical protein
MATKTKLKKNVGVKAGKASRNITAKKVGKPAVKNKVAKSVIRKLPAKAVVNPATKPVFVVSAIPSLPASHSVARPKPLARPSAKPKTKVKVKPSYTPLTSEERRILRNTPPQFTYMNPPSIEHEFQVGDVVEVFCDHEKAGDRVRGWVKGIVVQVDNKLVAVQFRSNVFLTDGWMVPDRILWFPLTSEQIRESLAAKRGVHREIPDY